MAGKSAKNRHPVIVTGDVGTVQTASGQAALLDADDAERVGAHSWHTNNAGYIYSWINKKHIDDAQVYTGGFGHIYTRRPYKLHKT